MISFKPTIARLQEAGFAHVEGLLEMAALTEAPRISPALFIVPERSTAAANSLGANAVDQKVTETFTVVIALQAVRLVGGTSEELQEHAAKVMDALLGWQHPEASRPCEFAGERLMSLQGRQVSWGMSFMTSRHIRKVSQ